MPRVSESGIIHTLPLLVVVASVGVIAFLIISSTLPTGGLFGILNPKPASHAAEIIPPNCPDSLQAKVDAAPSGGIVTLTQNCVYRQAVSVGKPLTIDGTNQAQIRGSDIWTGFNTSGATWVSTNTVPMFGTESGEAHFTDPFQATHPEQVFLDGTELQQVASNPTATQFALDGTRHIVLGTNPVGRIVEVTTRNRWVNVNADDVTVTNITLRHAGTTAQSFAIGNNDRARFTLSNSFIADAHGSAISLGRDLYSTLRNNTITRNGDLGITTYTDGHSLIQGNKIYGNGFGGFDWGWGAGGMKTVASTNLTIDDNEVYDNNGPGIWCDIGCNTVTISNNKSYKNIGPQIFFEISVGGKIFGNKVWNGDNSLPWPAIYDSSSADVEIYNNIVAFSDRGIQAYEQDRPDKPAQGVINTYIHDNTVIMNNDGKIGLMWGDYGNGRVTASGSNNRALNNKFWYPNPEGQYRFQWGGTVYNLIASFGQVSGGTGSSYITTSQKDALLTQNNMPSCPTCPIPTAPTSPPTSAPTPTTPPQTQSPFNGPHNIPGLIQAEDYDNGGEGLAYHDVEATNLGVEYGSTYRTTEGVDTKITSDTGGGYAIGWIQNGEWMEYTTNVSSTGTYNVMARVCTGLNDGQTRSLTLLVDGVNKGAFTIPFTVAGPNSDWCAFQDITLPGVQLSTGIHLLAVVSAGDWLDFNSLVFSSASTPTPSPTPAADVTPPTVSITSPTNGSTVPRGKPFTITATASDNVAVQRVEFYVNGSQVCAPGDTTSPYSCSWTVPNSPNKKYNLTARAYDTRGNQKTSSTVTVTSSR